MILASRSLEQSLFTWLKSDSELIAYLGGERLFEAPHRDSVFPYLTVATAFSHDWSTGTEPGEEHRLIISVWSSISDRSLQQSILARLRTILTNPDLALADHTLINWHIERCEVRSDTKNRLLQGTLQIRVTTEQNHIS